MNLKELAKHLKLSPTTVSRALNGYPEVGAETKRRVSEEARRFGYQPNPHARRLATGRSHAIGHVFPTDRSLMIDPLFSDFVPFKRTPATTPSPRITSNIVPKNSARGALIAVESKVNNTKKRLVKVVTLGPY